MNALCWLLDYFPFPWIRRWLRRPKTTFSFDEKSHDQLITEIKCLDEVSAKYFYFQIMNEMKSAVSSDDETNVIKLHKLLISVGNVISNEKLRNYHQSLNLSSRSINFVILACKSKAIKILKYLLSEENIFLLRFLAEIEENSIFPWYEDDECHNAIYYAIRSNSTVLLQILIEKWPGDYFGNNPEELDTLLSKGYRELKLKNVHITKDMEIFIQSKILDLRFFHMGENNESKNSTSLIIQRIDMVLENIKCIRTEFWDSEPDEKFVLIATFIAKNIHVIKSQLKSTYSVIPWEEMEFCLIMYIHYCLNQIEISLVYRVVLSKMKILIHLENFSDCLSSAKENIRKTSIDDHAKPLRGKRDKVLQQIIVKTPSFENLYEDYTVVRDFYSLTKIKSYIDIALSCSATEREGQLIITRALQVLGEHIKNTLYSPKLSNESAQILLGSLQTNTKDIVMSLRDSLSHADSLCQRSEIESCEDSIFVNFFSDLTKIKMEITNIIYRSKILATRELLRAIAECKDSVILETVLPVNYLAFQSISNDLIETLSETPIKSETEILEDLVTDFKKLLEYMTSYEKTLFDDLSNAIQMEKAKFQIVKSRCEHDILVLVNVLSIIKREFIYFDPQDIIHWIRSYVRENFEIDTSNSNLRRIENLYLSLLCSIKPRITSLNYELGNNILKFFSIFPDCKKRIKWLEKFRNILFKNKVSHRRFAKQSHEFDAKMKELLFNKCSQLQKTLVENNLNTNVLEHLPPCKKRSKLQILIEMLVLDIMAILGDSINSLTHNPFFLDSDFCMPVGKILRNHLAHGNVLNYILIGEDCMAILLNARKIITENLLRDDRKIGKRVKLDLVRTKTTHIKDLSNIMNQQKMFISFSEGNIEEVKECITKGADIHGKDRNLWTILHFAAKGPNIECIKLSLTMIPDVNTRDIKGQTALHIATIFKRRDIIQYLTVEEEMFVDTRDAFGKTPLHIASENGWTEGVQTLLKYKASVTSKDFFGFAALHLAIVKNNLEVALILLERESNVDENEVFAMTALHLAARRGNVHLLNTLLERNADVNRKCLDHFTPLHCAVESGNLEIVKYLIEKKADVDASDRSGSTPLYYAIRNCDGAVLSLQQGSTENTVTDDQNFISTASVVCARKEYLDMVKFLIKNGANVNKKDNDGRTPLHLAVETGCRELVKLLLRNKALVNSEDKNKMTALHSSAVCGHKHILEILIEAGGNIHAPDIDGCTPLHLAAGKGHIHIVEFLIDRGVDINATEEYGLTALHISTTKRHNGIIKLLLKNKANIYTVDCSGWTPFYLSVAKEMSELYLVTEIDINFRDTHGYTPLHVAAIYGDETLLKYCLNKSCNINVQCLRGFTALHFAAVGGHLKIVQLLLENGSNINAKRHDGCTALYIAIENNCENIVNVLLKKGAERQSNLAHIAAQKGYVTILKLLSQFNDFDINHRIENSSLLDAAISCFHINVVTYLLERGFKINSAVDGNTALHMASFVDNCEAAHFLLSKGANPNIQPIDFSPLHIASSEGYTQLVEILLNGGANVLVKDWDERLAIEYAVEHNHLRVLELLLKVKGVNINFRTQDCCTLLHKAAKIGSLPMVKCLIRNGAQIRPAYGMKPVHIAAEANHKNVVEYFLDYTFCINEPGKDGDTLLHLAIFNNHPAIFELLIKKGADVNVFDEKGFSPIYKAALLGHRDFFNILLRNGAFYNTRKKSNSFTLMEVTKDKDIVTSLVYVKNLFTKVKINDVPGIKSILKEGASFPNGICIDAISAKKTTLLHYAAWKGYDEAVDLLLKHKANPNVRGKHDSLPLHYAVKFSHIGIIKMLLSSGALYNHLTDNNRTPRYYAVDPDVICLLDILHESFKKIEEGDSAVVDYLKKIKDVETAKAIMRAKNETGRTLVSVSIIANHPKVKCLKELFQEDVLKNLQQASTFTEEGCLDEALSSYKNVLERRIEIFSADDPGVLDIQQKIAVLLCKKGKYEEALNLFLEVNQKVENLKEVYSAYDIRTLQSKIRVIQDIVENKPALNNLDEIFIQLKEMLGLYDMNVLKVQLLLVTALEKENKFGEALKLIDEVIGNSFKCNDVNSSFVLLLCLSNKARLWQKLGNFKESIKIMNDIHVKIEEILDPHHPNILLVLTDLALIFYKQGEYEESLKILHRILDSEEVLFGTNHKRTLITQLQIADVLYKQDQFGEALRIYQKYLSEGAAILGEDNPMIRRARLTVHTINVSFESLASSKPVSRVRELKGTFKCTEKITIF